MTTAYEDLLRVQEHDTAVDQLRHRRGALPELAELAEVEDAVAAIDRTLADVTARRDEVACRQKKSEDELATVEAKITEMNGRLYSGGGTMRELQGMQADIESLRRRTSALEDEVLEAMTEREPLDDEITVLLARRGGHDEHGGRLRAAIAEAQAAIDADLVTERAERDKAAAIIPPDLAQRYERLRTKFGGIGAARLVGNRCTGCHLTLPATEIDRIKREPPDTLILCDQCGRILVRSS